MIYIVTGLPRTRTGWVANYLTAGKSLCWHEGLARSGSVSACVSWMRGRASLGLPTGISDSGALRYLPQIRRALPEAAWVVLLGNRERCEQSLSRASGFPDVDLREAEESAMRLSREPGVVAVPVWDLDNRIEDVARFCVPAWEHDSVRHAMMLSLNIQLTREAMRVGISQLLTHGFSGE